jgi:hypothetical protein
MSMGPSGLYITLPDSYWNKEQADAAIERLPSKSRMRSMAYSPGGWDRCPVRMDPQPDEVKNAPGC